MAVTVNDAIQNNSPKPLDNKYGVFASGNFRAYVSTTEANTAINSASRAVGLTVLVNVSGTNTEYWYRDGVADGNLVAKTQPVIANSPLSSSGSTISIQQANGSQNGYLSSSDWTLFNGKVGSVASAGAGTYNIYAGTSAGAVTIKTLSAGSNITITDVSNVLTIASTGASGNNLGSGSQIYTTTTGGALQLRSLTAGAGVTLTQSTNDINIAVAGQATPAPSSTVSSTPTVIATQTIANESAGILVVTVIGVIVGSAGSMTTAQRYVRYYKTGGTLTIQDGVFDIIPETTNTFTSTSWTIVVNGSNNFDVQVTGQAATNIKWSATLQNYSNS